MTTDGLARKIGACVLIVALMVLPITLAALALRTLFPFWWRWGNDSSVGVAFAVVAFCIWGAMYKVLMRMDRPE